MHKHKQYGFGVIEVIIILFVAAAIVFVGWKVYESQTAQPQPPQTETQNQTQQSSSQEQPQPAQETHATYTDSEYGYSFKYPKSWKASEESSDQWGKTSVKLETQDYTIVGQDIGYESIGSGAQMYVRAEPTTYSTAEAYFNRNRFLPTVAKDKKEITLGGVPALVYRFSYETSNQLNALCVNNGKAYTVVLAHADDTLAAYTPEFNALVASFTFVK